MLGISATFRTGRFWCSPAQSDRWTIFNARRLRSKQALGKMGLRLTQLQSKLPPSFPSPL